MDTPTFMGFTLTDMVESVADQDWKKNGVYTIYSLDPYTYLQSTILMITPTNDGAIARPSPCHAMPLLHVYNFCVQYFLRIISMQSHVCDI